MVARERVRKTPRGKAGAGDRKETEHGPGREPDSWMAVGGLLGAPAGPARGLISSVTGAAPLVGLARHTEGADDPLGGTVAAPAVADVLRRRGGGQPLDRTDAHRFGNGFGVDLSPVRLHTDATADTVSRSVGAAAFTYGRDIFFTQGTYAPGTRTGDRLLAHELAHVVQGSAGGAAATGMGVRIGRADDPAERAADRVADQVLGLMAARPEQGADTDALRELPDRKQGLDAPSEPIARTVRRANLKSLAKKAKQKLAPTKRKKHQGTHAPDAPSHGGPVGVVPIAQLRAASNAAHGARGASGGAVAASSRRGRAVDPDRVGNDSGEGSGPEPVGYTQLEPAGLGKSRRRSSVRGGAAPGGAVSSGNGYVTRAELVAALAVSESSESESESESAESSAERPAAGSSSAGLTYAGPEDIAGMLDGWGEESSSESEEESGEGSEQDLSAAPPPAAGVQYGNPDAIAAMFADVSEESSSESEEESEEQPAMAAPFVGLHYGEPQEIAEMFAEADSESSSEESSSEESSEDELLAAQLPPEPEKRRPSALDPTGPRAKTGRHRAFAARTIDSKYQNETKYANYELLGVLQTVARAIERTYEIIAKLEAGATVADVLQEVMPGGGIATTLQGCGDDTAAAIKALRAQVAPQEEFARRQDLPINKNHQLEDVSARRVRYDTADEQKQSAVTIRDGKLYRADGELVDTSGSSTFHTGNGAEIFVASVDGSVHMASHKIGKYHHSSLLAADEVSVGGEMKVTAGVIQWITNKSGHYLPTQAHLVQFLHWLGKDGVDLSRIEILEGFGVPGGYTAEHFDKGVSPNGAASGQWNSFHSLKLQAVLGSYIAERGRAALRAALAEKGWKLAKSEDYVTEPDPNEPGETVAVDDKEAIAMLKAKFGVPRAVNDVAIA